MKTIITRFAGLLAHFNNYQSAVFLLLCACIAQHAMVAASDTSAPAPPPLRLGSWGQTIKMASTTPTSVAYDQDDIPAFIEALEETGQNFVIYDVNSERDWLDFITFLDALSSKGSDLQVVAAMNSPHLGSNRWLPAGVAKLDDGIGCGIERWKYEREIMVHWLKAWQAAATNCSRVAATHPNLVAFTIDDFNCYVETASHPAALYGRRLTPDDVKLITQAAHSVKDSFQFMPVMYHGDENIVKAYVLGSNYGIQLFADEIMVVALSFYIEGDPLYAELEFFHSDTAEDCNAWEVYERVFVNSSSAPIWEQSIGGDQGVGRVQTIIDLKSGLNTVYFCLKPGPYYSSGSVARVFNGYGEVFWRVWDVSVKGVSNRAGPFGVPVPTLFEITEFNESFHVKLHKDPYNPLKASLGMGLPEDTTTYMANTDTRIPPNFPVETLPNSSTEGLLTHRLIAGRNKPYLLREIVDGMICTSVRAYTLSPASTSCSGITVPLWSYSAADYQALLEKMKAHWANRTFVSLHHAMLTGTTIDPDILTNQLAIAASIADVTAVWNWPIGVHYLGEKRGIFAQSLSDDMDYSLMAFWPGRQFDLPGWCQRWVLAGYTGELTVTMKDNRDSGDATNILFKSVYVGGAPATIYGPEDVSADAASVELPSPGLTVSLKPGENLNFSVDLGEGAGDWSTKVYFKVTDKDGKFLPYSRFTYRTGLTEDTALTVYQKVRDLFTDLR